MSKKLIIIGLICSILVGCSNSIQSINKESDYIYTSKLPEQSVEYIDINQIKDIIEELKLENTTLDEYERGNIYFYSRDTDNMGLQLYTNNNLEENSEYINSMSFSIWDENIKNINKVSNKAILDSIKETLGEEVVEWFISQDKAAFDENVDEEYVIFENSKKINDKTLKYSLRGRKDSTHREYIILWDIVPLLPITLKSVAIDLENEGFTTTSYIEGYKASTIKSTNNSIIFDDNMYFRKSNLQEDEILKGIEYQVMYDPLNENPYSVQINGVINNSLDDDRFIRNLEGLNTITNVMNLNNEELSEMDKLFKEAVNNLYNDDRVSNDFYQNPIKIGDIKIEIAMTKVNYMEQGHRYAIRIERI